MALGMIVVTVLSMIGAIVVTPAATSLLGERVNMWQIGGAPSEGGGAIARIVRRVSRRPALAAGTLAALMLGFAAPVLAIETTPADPRVLPEHSDGLAAFHALRAAKLGPEVDVALAAPKGTLLDPKRLEQIKRLERRIAATPLVRAVMGPGLIADSTTEVRAAPKQIGKSRRDLAAAEGELTARSRQLERARRKARRQAADLGAGLQQAKNLLDSGHGLLAATSARGGDVDRLVLGLTVARDGARQLADGTQTLGTQAGRLADGLREIRKRVDGLVPSIAAGQSALRDAQARLNLLRVPAQTNQRELESALAALDRPAPPARRTPRSRRRASTSSRRSRPRAGQREAAQAGYPGLDTALTRSSRWRTRPASRSTTRSARRRSSPTSCARSRTAPAGS